MSTDPLTPLQTRFRAARTRGVPIVGIQTPDPGATISQLTAARVIGDAVAVLRWDIVQGLTPINELGARAREATLANLDPSVATNPSEMLALLPWRLPKDTILFFSNAHRIFQADTNGGAVAQGIWNVRDPFKENGRMLVLLAPTLTLPTELTNDVVVLDEPLPDAKELRTIVGDVLRGVDMVVADAVMEATVDGVRGLSAFSAEQVVAMSLTKSGVNVERVWERKRSVIDATPGLKMWRGRETFDDVEGCANIKDYLTRLLNGPKPPGVLVFIDEIEKQFAGAGSDSSGTKTNALGTMLTYMEDRGVRGLLFLGHPGAAKSAIAKAVPLPKIVLDLPSTEASLVGESNANLRNALKVISAVSDDNALFIGTCNSLASLPPALRRRFKRGMFFFDLPTRAERNAIWSLYQKKFQLADPQPRPRDTDWTGAEIRNCCETAVDLNCSLVEAAAFVVPSAVSAAEDISSLRRESSGRYISASTPGVYRYDPTANDPEPTQPTIVVVAPAASRRRVNKKELN